MLVTLLAGHYAFNYAWTVWDRLFGTEMVALLASLGVECPSEPPSAWGEILKPSWDHAVALRRKQTFFSRVSLGNSGGTPVYYKLLCVWQDQNEENGHVRMRTIRGMHGDARRAR